ncbi:MAG: cysteine synthase family protein [Blastocatellia bacterium]|nr:cysteine synthase family protein [Blastocatellia bacterium]MBL8194626.1 cysteine synthase family protein [Blastocatellia bacterium]MBN8722120.1 cysteine synthase family protein [Acidobacteriota bacterium]
MLDLIGNTPLVELRSFSKNPSVKIFAKLELMNPSGSLKDRIAKYMIESAEATGKLTSGKTIIEASSGNTGISLSMVGSLKGYRTKIFMPESKSIERRIMMRMWGAELILTPRNNPHSHIEAAKELSTNTTDYFYIDQNENQDNVLAHYHHTAAEILEQMPGSIDAVIAGIGTGGTIMGVGRRLKEANSKTQVVAVQPAEGISKIEGLLHLDGSYVPGICDLSLIDKNIYVEDPNAIETACKLALQEGIFAGISSGAVLYAALSLAETMEKGQIVIILGDRGERYLSTDLCLHARS